MALRSYILKLQEGKMPNLNLYSCGQGISLVFDSREFMEEMLGSDFIKKYIPSPEIEHGGIIIPAKINVSSRENFSFSGDYPEFNYCGNNLYDVLFLSEFMLERARQEADMYSIHSSSASRNGKAVLLFGWKDTGKTSVALHLAREHGFKFLSEGRTVMDKDFRITGKIHHIEEDNDYLKERYGFDDSCLDVSRLCPISSDNDEMELMIYPQITGYPLEIRPWDFAKASYHMHELFGYVIRGATKNLNNYQCPVQSIDTPELAKKRCKFVNSLVNSKKVIQIRGSLEDICKTIDSMMA